MAPAAGTGPESNHKPASAQGCEGGRAHGATSDGGGRLSTAKSPAHSARPTLRVGASQSGSQRLGSPPILCLPGGSLPLRLAALSSTSPAFAVTHARSGADLLRRVRQRGPPTTRAARGACGSPPAGASAGGPGLSLARPTPGGNPSELTALPTGLRTTGPWRRALRRWRRCGRSAAAEGRSSRLPSRRRSPCRP